MTELMKQLQQWADEGRYDFQGKRFKVNHLWSSPIDLEEQFHVQLENFRELPSFFINNDEFQQICYVLDGTIQVWLPVEHYKPTGAVLVLTALKAKPYFVARPYQDPHSGQWVFDSVELQRVVSFTHWQPLPAVPQPPQEVK